MTLLDFGLFFGVSVVASAINSVAGGGTFLTFPVFIFNGLTALQANIMSTIALWPGTLASAYGYRGVMEVNRKALLPFLGTALIGGAVGALLLLSTPEVVFERLVPWLLLTATLIFTFGKRGIAWLPFKGGKKLGILLQFGIAVYGGYFGAGIGILTLAMLQLLGLTHIHQMNALKTVLTFAINVMSVLIFIVSGRVLWDVGVVMIAGALVGGYFGARLSLKVAPEKVRMLVSAIGFGMTVYFFLK